MTDSDSQPNSRSPKEGVLNNRTLKPMLTKELIMCYYVYTIPLFPGVISTSQAPSFIVPDQRRKP